MRKFVQIVLGLLASLSMLSGLVACQSGQQTCSNVSLPEMDVVRGIDYRPGDSVPGYNIAGAALTPADLGPVYDTINTDIHGCAAPASGNYSTFLAAGTQLYTIKGYQPWFRLAIKEAASGSKQSIVFIEAIANPHASKGNELMQLDNKVDSILLYPASNSSSSTPSPLETASSPRQVVQLIALFDQAPVQAGLDTRAGMTDWLVFHFRDGTISGLLYDPTTGWTNREAVLPSTFASLLGV